MAGNLKIRTLGNWSLGITAVLAILCIAMSILGFRKYEVLQSSTRDYIACEAAAQRLQTGSDTLTRQVRLAAATVVGAGRMVQMGEAFSRGLSSVCPIHTNATHW